MAQQHEICPQLWAVSAVNIIYRYWKSKELMFWTERILRKNIFSRLVILWIQNHTNHTMNTKSKFYSTFEDICLYWKISSAMMLGVLIDSLGHEVEHSETK